MGLVGALAYAGWFMIIIRKAVRSLAKFSDPVITTLATALIGCMISLLIHGLFDFTLIIRPTMFLLMFLLGAIVALTNDRSPASLDSQP